MLYLLLYHNSMIKRRIIISPKYLESNELLITKIISCLHYINANLQRVFLLCIFMYVFFTFKDVFLYVRAYFISYLYVTKYRFIHKNL